MEIKLSHDPERAERQMRAIIFYLTAFGHIDGDFHEDERAFIEKCIHDMAQQRASAESPDAGVTTHDALVVQTEERLNTVFRRIDQYIANLITESVAEREEQGEFIRTKLKQRCFEIFQEFDVPEQVQLLKVVDALMGVEDNLHPAEALFRRELIGFSDTETTVELIIENRNTKILDIAPKKLTALSDPFFEGIEEHYSSDPALLAEQLKLDGNLIDRTIGLHAIKRASGRGKLDGVKSISEFQNHDPFLDRDVHVFAPKRRKRYELTVLGDLHGCYSCLKGAILQSGFLKQVRTYKSEPEKQPFPLLVFLGDYIDRGRFSMEGVLRAAMRLFVEFPEHVILLRGNHEYFLEHKKEIFGGVNPAEAINTLKPHVSNEALARYKTLFEHLPHMLTFDRILFAHAGIPRDRIIRERWKDLSSLNDPDIRFQMMWSDPSDVDVIPAQLQEHSARFPFGRMQAAAFLQRIGCHTLIRGHETVADGFAINYNDIQIALMTLFSAGGSDNKDLPTQSTYRNISPKAMTLTWENGETQIQPWNIDYRSYNRPENNGFYQSEPELQTRTIPPGL